MKENLVPEEEKIRAGILFCPADPELVAIKRKAHNLDVDYNSTHEDETEKRAAILYSIDERKAIRQSHNNPDVIRLYDDYLGSYGSEKAEEILHTSYRSNRERYPK